MKGRRRNRSAQEPDAFSHQLTESRLTKGAFAGKQAGRLSEPRGGAVLSPVWGSSSPARGCGYGEGSSQERAPWLSRGLGGPEVTRQASCRQRPGSKYPNLSPLAFPSLNPARSQRAGVPTGHSPWSPSGGRRGLARGPGGSRGLLAGTLLGMGQVVRMNHIRSGLVT